jgi:hypothetical protein
MSIKAARVYARAARKSAPPDQYDYIRKLELAIDELAKEIEALKGDVRRSPPRG